MCDWASEGTVERNVWLTGMDLVVGEQQFLDAMAELEGRCVWHAGAVDLRCAGHEEGNYSTAEWIHGAASLPEGLAKDKGVAECLKSFVSLTMTIVFNCSDCAKGQGPGVCCLVC